MRKVTRVTAVVAMSFLLLLSLSTVSVSAAEPPQPTYGTATVDGDSVEWKLTEDFFAHMYRAGKPTKEVESELYLRYDCSTKTMYVLVLAVAGVPILVEPDEAWVAMTA